MPRCYDPRPKSDVKAINEEALPKAVKERLDDTSDEKKAKYFGVGGNAPSLMDAPPRANTLAEKVIAKGNARIVLGVDRITDITSGYGALGNTHCSAIDIVVGMGGIEASTFTENGEPIFVNPDPKRDAARVYISQRSNIDAHFSLPAGKKGNSTDENPGSAIALKADKLRLIARENIKIICRTDALDSKNGKMGNASTTSYGIDLIGLATNVNSDPGPEQGLQPLVKGDNLTECLESMITWVGNVVGLVDNLAVTQASIIDAIQKHRHYTGFYKHETAPDFETLMPGAMTWTMDNASSIQAATKMDSPKEQGNIKSNYLNPGPKHILSDYNNTN
jgi:hypothetical protein